MKSKRFSAFIQWGIIGVWLFLVCVLVYRHYVKGVAFTPLQSLSEKQFKTSEEWLGIYVQDQKVGYVKTVSEKIGDEYRFTQSGETEIVREGKTIRGSTRFTCLTDLEYGIKSFDFETRSGETFFKSHGEIDDDDMLLLFTETEDGKKTSANKIEGRTYLAATIKQMLFAQGLENGKRYTVPVLDIFSLKVNDAIVEVQDLVPVKVGIHVNTAYVLKIGESLSWLSDGGHTLKEIPAAGFTYLAETEAQAKSKGAHQMFDFLAIPALQSNQLLSDAESLSRLKVRLTGIQAAEYPMLDGGRQGLNGDVLEISREDIQELKAASYELPNEDKGLKQFLAPAPFVQSDHQTIIYNAKKFVAIEKNAFDLARFLTSNLFLTITKMPVSRLNTAMDVFETPAGESNEHTVLFTAFARAGGMPTRMVGGLVYRKGYFYYHAWPEVWLDRWVAVDPALGQFPADVTHIRLIDGDIKKIASLGSVIGKMKIDIIEAL